MARTGIFRCVDAKKFQCTLDNRGSCPKRMIRAVFERWFLSPFTSDMRSSRRLWFLSKKEEDDEEGRSMVMRSSLRRLWFL